jgi:hypothetical protein
MRSHFKIPLIFTLLILLGISTFFVVNSKNQEKTNEFKKTIESTATRDKLPGAKEGKGVSLGLYNVDGNIETSSTFHINEGEKLEKFISIGNLIDNSRKYKILLFVDFKQSSFLVDNNKVKSFDVEIDSNKTLEIPVAIDNLENGFHDIFFAIVKNPDNKSLDNKYRVMTDMSHMLFIRFNTVVESSTKPKINFTEFKTSNNPRLSGVILTKENNYKSWLTEKVKANQELKYYIHLENNSYKNINEYAVIVLQDWKQVPIKDQEALFTKVGYNQSISIPSAVTTPSKRGVTDLTPILIHNPYGNLEDQIGNIETAIRVGLDVK